MPDKVRPVELKQYRGPRSPRLYKVCLGSGYLELPQEWIKYSTAGGAYKVSKCGAYMVSQWGAYKVFRLGAYKVSQWGAYKVSQWGAYKVFRLGAYKIFS